MSMQTNNLDTTNLLPRIINPAGKLPKGISSFVKLVQEDYTFIDKSLFIKEVLDSGDEAMLITRPRRFGKTLNMRMLQAFLKRPITEEDNLFNGLAIQELGNDYLQERGKRPVLYLSFKNIKGNTWESAFTALRTLLAETVDYVTSEYVNELSLPRREILDLVHKRKASTDDCRDTLAILTELLTTQYNQKPWVLIDEYDTPMQNAYQHGFYDSMRELMQGLLSKCLKDNDNPARGNPFLHRAVLTGILRIAKEDIFSGLNNFGCYGVLDEEFSQHFGFIPSEVDSLLDQKGLGKEKETVREWYNGYQFGEATVYNPWSIISFAGSKKVAPQLYWVNTSNNHLVHQLLAKADTEIKQDLKELLAHPAGHTIHQKLRMYVLFRQLENNPRNLWGLLLSAGYLTAKAHEISKIGDNVDASICLPNKEVKCLYEGIVERWLEGEGPTSGYALINYLIGNNLPKFVQEFSSFFHESVSYFDVTQRNPERFYHGFIMGMLQYMRDSYIILSQRESGIGRYDVALEPMDKNAPGFLFEFKSCIGLKGSVEEIEAQLEGPAEEALQQIKEKDYVSQLFSSGVKRVHALGLAFSGKEVKVVWESLE